MNERTALAKPSFSLVSVTRRAARCTWGSALPMAMLRPEWANIKTSLGMSPMVAISSVESWYRVGEVLDHLALVGLGMGDVEVVGLRGGRGHVVAEALVGRRRGLGHRVVVVAHSHDLGHVVGEAVEARS